MVTTSISSKPLLASDAATRVATSGTPKNRERRDVDLITDVVGLLSSLAGQDVAPGGADSLSSTVRMATASSRPRFCSGATSIRRWHVRRSRESGRRRRSERSTASGTRSRSERSRAARRSRGSRATSVTPSLKVTTDIYGHWERAERKLQAAKMEGAFSV